MLVNLHLTHKCNLRCTYCYTGDKTLGDMSPATLRQSFAFMEQLPADAIDVVFFGGEPLVRFDLMQEAVALAAGLDKAYHFKVTTNGTLLDPGRIDWLRAHEVYVSVSVDGPGQANDVNRVFPDGSGSWRLIEPQLAGLLAAMPHSGVFLVVHPANMERLADSVGHVLDLGFRFVNLALDYSADWTPALFERLSQAYVALAKVYETRTRRGERFYLSVFDGRIQTRVRGQPALSERCSPGVGTLSIAPSGHLYPCVQFVREDRQPQLRIGHVDRGLASGHDRHCSGCDEVPDDTCGACFLKDRCSHWCRCVSYQTTGDAEQVSPVFCAHEQLIFEIADRLAGRMFDRRFPRFVHKHYNDDAPFLAALEDLLDEALPVEA